MSWTPADMDSELIQWLKADAITGLVDTDPVSTWLDSSPNGRNVTGASTARPLYLTNQINSLPAVDFDGSNDVMSSGSFTLAGEKCVATGVVRLDSLKDFQPPWLVHTTSSPTFPAAVNWGVVNANGSAYGGGLTAYLLSPVSQFSASQFCIITVVANDLFGVGIRLNGKAMSPAGGSGGTPPITNVTGTAYTHLGDGGTGLGGGRWFDGKLAELVIYDNTHCDDIWIEGYLADKYAITLSASHPFYGSAPTTGPRGGAIRPSHSMFQQVIG